MKRSDEYEIPEWIPEVYGANLGRRFVDFIVGSKGNQLTDDIKKVPPPRPVRYEGADKMISLFTSPDLKDFWIKLVKICNEDQLDHFCSLMWSLLIKNEPGDRFKEKEIKKIVNDTKKAVEIFRRIVLRNSFIYEISPEDNNALTNLLSPHSSNRDLLLEDLFMGCSRHDFFKCLATIEKNCKNMDAKKYVDKGSEIEGAKIPEKRDLKDQMRTYIETGVSTFFEQQFNSTHAELVCTLRDTLYPSDKVSDPENVKRNRFRNKQDTDR